MATDQVFLNLSQVQSAPLDYTVPGSIELALQAVSGTFDGTGAAASFLPALQIIGPGGIVGPTFVDPSTPVSSGGSAEVTFGTFLRQASGGTTTGGYTEAEDNGVLVSTGESILNFTGAGVTVTDDPGNTATIVNIPGGSSSITDVEVFQSAATVIAPSSPTSFSLAHVSGSTLLNYTTPTAPTIITAGIYALNVWVSSSTNFSVGRPSSCTAHMVSGGFTMAETQGFVSATGQQLATHALTLVRYMAAGSNIEVILIQFDTINQTLRVQGNSALARIT